LQRPESLLGVRSVRQLALLLNCDYAKHLVYYLYRGPVSKNYREFDIPKRSGGTRRISAPQTNLIILQRSLAAQLERTFKLKASVHGFAKGRSIVSNAAPHVKASHVLNIDIQDFFPSINFGRVRGLFMSKPYSLPASVATVIAQICCHENALPQGAPTSPIVSNMICARLDTQLRNYAKVSGIFYTRYADDLTFSTRKRQLPQTLGNALVTDGKREFQIATELRKLIESNGFTINNSKTRYFGRNDRRVVTSLVVNRTVNLRRNYIRHVRAMLHSWRTDGAAKALDKHLAGKRWRVRNPALPPPSFEAILRGKLSYMVSVRGSDDPLAVRLIDRFNSLATRPIRVKRSSMPDNLYRAIWVIEDHDEASQATAFFLKDVGIVSCDHGVFARPYIYHPSEPTRKIDLKVLKRESAIDLAVLAPASDTISTEQPELSRSGTEILHQGHEVTLYGYPAFALGKDISKRQGTIAGYRMASSVRRLILSCAIIAGNSGGPVVNHDGKVVGVAVRGAKNADSAEDVYEHEVVPITALSHLGF
jgi:RNA-directed DNA polymerase